MPLTCGNVGRGDTVRGPWPIRVQCASPLAHFGSVLPDTSEVGTTYGLRSATTELPLGALARDPLLGYRSRRIRTHISGGVQRPSDQLQWRKTRTFSRKLRGPLIICRLIEHPGLRLDHGPRGHAAV
jgi:hypothetical protein